MRAGLGLWGRIAPRSAASWFQRQFLTPRRAPASAQAAFGGVAAERVPYGNRWLKVWHFGQGPTVLFVHGWSGRAAQFDAWVAPTVAAGFRAVLFDAPAHGGSGGRTTNLLDFAGAVQHVGGLAGPVAGIVAHSFGAPAAIMAARYGLATPRLALLAPPTSLAAFSRVVARHLGLPDAVAQRMQAGLERRLDFRWADVESDKLAGDLAADGRRLLVVHDRRDREVPFAAGARIAAAAGARLVATDGLGHNRLLADPTVIQQSLAFLAGRDAAAGALAAATVG
jgi:pimeloyl-ACP methyl ester carboxylesterase